MHITKKQLNRLAYGSYVLQDIQLLFVETPKVACSSFKHVVAAIGGVDVNEISASLAPATTQAMTIHDRDAILLPSLVDLPSTQATNILRSSEFVRFCVVRNPFARLASAWVDKIMCHSLSPIAPVAKFLGFPHYRADINYLREQFSEFVAYLYHHEAPDFSNHHWFTLNELLLPDFINYTLEIRLENLETGLQRLAAHVEQQGIVWPGLPRFNETRIHIGLDIYTPATIQRVAEMYERDFKRYEYATKIDKNHRSFSRLPETEAIRATQESNQRVFYLSLKARGII